VFSLRSSFVLPHRVRLQVSTTMLPPVLLSSVLLLLIAHIRLRPVCFRSSLTTKAVPRCIITNPESNDAVHSHLNDNIMVATTHMFDSRCQTSITLSAASSPRLPSRTARYERCAAQYGCYAQAWESSTRAGEVLKLCALSTAINNKKRFLGLAVKNLARLHNLQGR
jgi:hypothetical protein